MMKVLIYIYFECVYVCMKNTLSFKFLINVDIMIIKYFIRVGFFSKIYATISKYITEIYLNIDRT